MHIIYNNYIHTYSALCEQLLNYLLNFAIYYNYF